MAKRFVLVCDGCGTDDGTVEKVDVARGRTKLNADLCDKCWSELTKIATWGQRTENRGRKALTFVTSEEFAQASKEA